MDLSSASTYLNNLLVKGGLLKGGMTVPFHNPSVEDGSITRIINLVHDLVTRREREEEQLESLAHTIRQLRHDNAKLLQTNDKLNLKCEDFDRKNAILEGQHRATHATLRASESSVKALRDETTRLKMVVQQVRSQFANDIRKRDVQLGKIKEQLLNPRRSVKSANTITITGTAPLAADMGPQHACGPDCIAQDTADALTELSQTLANENDNLVSITRQTLSTLNSIQGIKDDFQLPSEERLEESSLSVFPQFYDSLSEELQLSLASLRDMINHPSHVAIEEVQERDKIIEGKDIEIEKLKRRIEVVEEEWRKAIEMVKMWNESIRGQLPRTAVKPANIHLGESVCGLENIPEEDEEEGEEYTRVVVDQQPNYPQAGYQEGVGVDGEHTGDISLDEEQLQREASMVMNTITEEDLYYMEEEDAQEGIKNFEDMLETGVDNIIEATRENRFEEKEEQVEIENIAEEHTEGVLWPGEQYTQIEREQSEEMNILDEAKQLRKAMNQVHFDEANETETHIALDLNIKDTTPPPTSPPNSPPARPKRTPKTRKARLLDENISPSPMKTRRSLSKQTHNLRRSPRKVLIPAPSIQSESPEPPLARKKATKRAHFDSPVVQDTPSTPPRVKYTPKPQFIPQKQHQHTDMDVDKTPSTPKTTRVTRKRVLLETPEKSAASTRTSKRRKTPAVKNGVSRVFGNNDDEIEDSS